MVFKKLSVFLIQIFFLCGCAFRDTDYAKVDIGQDAEDNIQVIGDPGKPVEEVMQKEKWTLKDCYAIALAYNDQLKLVHEDYFQSVILKQRAWAGILPSLSLRTNYTKQETAGQFGSLEERHEEKIVLEQPIFQGFKEYYGIGQARQNILAKEALVRFEQSQIFAYVAKAFYEILKLESAKITLQDLIKIQESRLEYIHERYKLGLVRKTEVLSIETDLEDAHVKLVRIDGELQVAKIHLEVLLGLSIAQKLEDNSDRSSIYALDELLQQAYFNRDDLIAVKHQIEVAQKQISISYAHFWPTVSLLGNWYLDRNGPQENVDWDVSVGTSWSIFEGGALRAQLKEAYSKLKQAEIQYELQKKNIREEVTRAFSTYRSLDQELVFLKKKTELAQENYQLIEEEYKHGLATHLDVQQVYQKLMDSKLAFNQAKWDHQLVIEEMHFVSGDL